MAYQVPTLDELTDFLVDLGRSLFPGADLSRESLLWKLTRTFAGGATDNHANIATVERDAMPDRAVGEALDRWAALLGVERKAATGSQKAGALRVYGSPTGAVVIGDELVSAGGLRFEVASNGTIPGGGTYVDVDIASIDTGRATRLEAGETLTFVSTPINIEESAELQIDLDEGGTDREQDGELRARVLNRLSLPALGGAENDYEQWALEVAGIATAYCYPARAGLGSVDLVALKDATGTARVLTAGEKTEVFDYIEAVRPVGVDFRVLDITTKAVDVEIAVTPTGNPEVAFDWNDDTPLTVSTWTAGTRTLKFSASRPASMDVGDRIVLKPVAGDGTGQQYRIEAFGAAADEVILEEAPSPAPVATDVVYSGGPLVDTIRDAIIAHMSGRAVYASDEGPIPADVAGDDPDLPVLVEGIGPANPAGVYGDWNGELRLGVLYKLALAPGVLDVEIVTPTANVTAEDPVYPDDDAIEMIVHGRIIVRKG